MDGQYVLKNNKMRKIHLYILFILIAVSTKTMAQIEYSYTNGKELTLLGRAPSSTSNYQRLDTEDTKSLPERVQTLAQFSAGISLVFQTNSKNIAVNWKLARLNNLWHMSSLGVNGLDLYGWNGKSWQFVASAQPKAVDNNAVFITNLDGEFRHYRVFFPVYSEVTNIEIGVLKDAKIKPADKSFIPAKKVAIYGSSVTSGNGISINSIQKIEHRNIQFGL